MSQFCNIGEFYDMQDVKGYVYNRLNIVDRLNKRFNERHLRRSLPNITLK